MFLRLNEYDGELSPKSMVEYLSNNIDIEKKKLFDLSVVFITLIHTLNSYAGNIDEFVEQIGDSYNDKFPDDGFDDKKTSDVKGFLENGAKSTIRAMVSESMAETSKYYIESSIFQDLRTTFDDKGNVIASGIIHNLKISTRTGNKKKYDFIAMDSKDLESLLKEIKKAQENAKNIHAAFDNANILDL